MGIWFTRYLQIYYLERNCYKPIAIRAVSSDGWALPAAVALSGPAGDRSLVVIPPIVTTRGEFSLPLTTPVATAGDDSLEDDDTEVRDGGSEATTELLLLLLTSSRSVIESSPKFNIACENLLPSNDTST